MDRKTSSAGAKALGVVLTLGILTACQSSPGVSPSDAESSSASSGAPSSSAAAGPEGEFIIATDSLQGEIFDPSMAFVGSNFYLRLIYDSLTGADDEGRPSREGGVAEDWVISDDRMTLTYTLREGLQFADGSPLTSEDVKFSIERAMRPDARGAWASYLQEFIASVDAPDPLTVVVNHIEPTTLTVDYLGPSHSEGMVVSKAYFEAVGEEQFALEPLGSGPYQLAELVPGSSMTFDAADSHVSLRHPLKEEVVIQLVPEPSTRRALLERDEVDFINVGSDMARELEAEDYPIIVSTGSNQLLALTQLQSNGEPIGEEWPIFDIRIREAMSLAVNREEIAEHIFQGYAQPATAFRTIPAFLETVGASPDDYADEYDPDRARQLVEEAGYPEAFGDNAQIDMFAHPHGGLGQWRDYTDYLASAWRAIGLDINMMVGEVSVWNSGWQAQEIPGTVAINAPDISAASWIDQLIAYRSFLYPSLPRALVWDLELGEMLDEIVPLGEDDPDAASQALLDVASYIKDEYYSGFSFVTVDSTFAAGKDQEPWTPRPLPNSFGDFAQVIISSD